MLFLVIVGNGPFNHFYLYLLNIMHDNIYYATLARESIGTLRVLLVAVDSIMHACCRKKMWFILELYNYIDVDFYIAYVHVRNRCLGYDLYNSIERERERGD